jgi:hypothetical protein
LNFRTTIKNHITDEEIINPRQIAITYVKTRFAVDLISTIPYDYIFWSSQTNFKFRIFTILKMIRIVRFTKVIAYMNATDSVRLSLKLFKLIFYLITYIHLQACAWFYYTKWDRTWYPLPDIIQAHYHFYDNPILYQYCFSVWHSVSILDGEDMVPATEH